MKKIPKDNQTGMKLYPGDAVKILVDNDYIMASLGVLSKTHRQGAIKLLSKSLGVDLKETEQTAGKAAFIEELQRMNAAKQAKEEERLKHIEEMEKMGYDMSEYKNPEKIGGATAEEVAEAKKEALMNDRSVKKAADFIESSDKNPDEYKNHVMRGCGEVDGRPNCNRDCKHCMRKHCPYRQE